MATIFFLKHDRGNCDHNAISLVVRKKYEDKLDWMKKIKTNQELIKKKLRNKNETDKDTQI